MVMSFAVLVKGIPPTHSVDVMYFNTVSFDVFLFENRTHYLPKAEQMRHVIRNCRGLEGWK